MKTALSLFLLLVVSVACESKPPVPYKPSVLYFTGFYCPFCWAEESDAKELSKVVDFYRVSDKETWRKYNVSKIPTVVVVDQDGRELAKYSGRGCSQEAMDFLSGQPKKQLDKAEPNQRE